MSKISDARKKQIVLSMLLSLLLWVWAQRPNTSELLEPRPAPDPGDEPAPGKDPNPAPNPDPEPSPDPGDNPAPQPDPNPVDDPADDPAHEPTNDPIQLPPPDEMPLGGEYPEYPDTPGPVPPNRDIPVDIALPDGSTVIRMTASAGTLAAAGLLAAADGPLPFGDAAAAGIIGPGALLSAGIDPDNIPDIPDLPDIDIPTPTDDTNTLL